MTKNKTTQKTGIKTPSFYRLAVLALLACLCIYAPLKAQPHLDHIYKTSPAAPKRLTFTEDRIEKLEANLTVDADGVLTVHETLQVAVNGGQIQQDVQRIIPTRYTGDIGETVQRNLTIVSIKRNGQNVPYRLEKVIEGDALIIGEEGRYLSRGLYLYELTYRLEGVLRRKEKENSLTWNISGGFLDYPVNSYHVTFSPPKDARILTQDSYILTDEGERKQGPRFNYTPKRQLYLERKKNLPPNESLFISVIISHEQFHSEAFDRTFSDFLRDNKSAQSAWVLLAAFLLLQLAVFKFIHPFEVKRAEKPPEENGDTITAPPSISPALASLLYDGRHSSRTFLCFLLFLLTRGHLLLRDEEEGLTFSAEQKSRKSLREKRRLFYIFMRGGNTDMRVSAEGTSALFLTYENLRVLLSRMKERACIHLYPVLYILNFLILLSAFALSALFTDMPSTALAFAAACLGIYAVAATTCRVTEHFFWRTFHINSLMERLSFIFILPALFSALYGTHLILEKFEAYSSPLCLKGLILLLVAHFASMVLYRLRSVLPAAMKERLTTYRTYLTMEQVMTHMAGIPEEALELYEKHLPYAFALRAEEAWTRRFVGVIQDNTTPKWYSGSKGILDMGPEGIIAFLSDVVEKRLEHFSNPDLEVS